MKHDIRDVTHTLLPSQLPVDRYRLYSMAQPYLRYPHQVADFRFFEATLLLVKSGQLSLRRDRSFMQLDNAEHIMLVAQHTVANISKTPEPVSGSFQSLYLSFSSELNAAFYRDHAQFFTTQPPLSGFKILSLDSELRDTLDYCLRGLSIESSSYSVQQHRLSGVLIALAERGIIFMPRASAPLGDRLTALLAGSPAFAWTAANAGQQLGMSEATLRRRLAEEQTQFRTLLQDIRMHHAMTLLQTTRWSLSQIADACGYRAASRFSLRFKQRFGCSPADIR
ncbi:AraC family transcriptional regulator [Brenneria roseae subsp. roseae]|uniref:helix-turn-helix transcriptional regulator n=1 Tax=Brenneria roseae TaxID=1509241 RepID=UPI000D61E525|nr:AraC family transcriptional regulator [Brenneria roseae]PWC20828.1 AraC family transcriptional regulator [Brenneria roseae subsp. roseae]